MCKQGVRIYTLKKRLVGISSQTLKNSKRPDLLVGLFFRLRALTNAYFILRDGCNGCDG